MLCLELRQEQLIQNTRSKHIYSYSSLPVNFHLHAYQPHRAAQKITYQYLSVVSYPYIF